MVGICAFLEEHVDDFEREVFILDNCHMEDGRLLVLVRRVNDLGCVRVRKYFFNFEQVPFSSKKITWILLRNGVIALIQNNGRGQKSFCYFNALLFTKSSQIRYLT